MNKLEINKNNKATTSKKNNKEMKEEESMECRHAPAANKDVVPVAGLFERERERSLLIVQQC